MEVSALSTSSGLATEWPLSGFSTLTEQMGRTFLLGRGLRGVRSLGIVHFPGPLFMGAFTASGRFLSFEPDPPRSQHPQAGTFVPPQLDEVGV